MPIILILFSLLNLMRLSIPSAFADDTATTTERSYSLEWFEKNSDKSLHLKSEDDPNLKDGHSQRQQVQAIVPETQSATSRDVKVITETPNFAIKAPSANQSLPPAGIAGTGTDENCPTCHLDSPGFPPPYQGRCAADRVDNCNVETGRACPQDSTYLNRYIDPLFTAGVSNDPAQVALRAVINAPPARPILKTECFAISMGPNSTSSSSIYRACEQTQAAPQTKYLGPWKGLRPCTTSRLVDLTANSFNTMASCLENFFLNDDQKVNAQGVTVVEHNRVAMAKLFALMSAESNFEMNSVSSSGLGGIGQFSSAATKDSDKLINPEMIDYIRRMASKNPTCDKVADLLSSNSLKTYNLVNGKVPGDAVCDRVSMDNGQPLLSMLYTAAYFQINRRTAHAILNNPIYQRKGVATLSPENRAALETETAMWAHNTGGPAMFGSGHALGAYKAALNAVGTFDNYSDPVQTIIDRMDNHVPSAGLNYIKNLRSHFAGIRSKAEGKECLAP